MLAVGSHLPGDGCRNALRARRACRARVRELRCAARPKRHYLKSRSVQPATLERYAKAAKQLTDLCAARRLLLHPTVLLDKAVEKYADHLSILGHRVSDVRYVVWGYAFLQVLVV